MTAASSEKDGGEDPQLGWTLPGAGFGRAHGCPGDREEGRVSQGSAGRRGELVRGLQGGGACESGVCGEEGPVSPGSAGRRGELVRGLQGGGACESGVCREEGRVSQGSSRRY